MPTVTFSSASSHYTLVSNDFLLRHMPQANGAYVKVYLFFLCHSQQPESSLSTAEAAKSLHMIESDVLEALYYWEKEGLLQIREIDGSMELHFLSGSIVFCFHPTFFPHGRSRRAVPPVLPPDSAWPD